MERKRLFLHGRCVGDCDADIFELAKIYLREGNGDIAVAKDFWKCGILNSSAIVINARRELRAETQERGVKK